MIRSMTGFGSAALATDAVQASVTIRSVNHRYLDLSLHLSRRIQGLEPELKRLLQSHLSRGKVELKANAYFAEAQGEAVRAVGPVVNSLVATLRSLRDAHGLAGDVSVADVARFPGAIEIAEPPADVIAEHQGRVLTLAAQALEQLEAMRGAEGRGLAEILGGHLSAVERAAERIEQQSEQGKAERLATLGARVRELQSELSLDEGRLHQELVRVVERSDVSEEVARLLSHAKACHEVIAAGGSCGKRLDFLAQELMREANTVGSKAASAAVVHEVVALKNEIERFREQVQNVE